METEKRYRPAPPSLFVGLPHCGDLHPVPGTSPASTNAPPQIASVSNARVRSPISCRIMIASGTCSTITTAKNSAPNTLHASRANFSSAIPVPHKISSTPRTSAQNVCAGIQCGTSVSPSTKPLYTNCCTQNPTTLIDRRHRPISPNLFIFSPILAYPAAPRARKSPYNLTLLIRQEVAPSSRLSQEYGFSLCFSVCCRRFR